jgi:hypothetical protein
MMGFYAHSILPAAAIACKIGLLWYEINISRTPKLPPQVNGCPSQPNGADLLPLAKTKPTAFYCQIKQN